MNKNEDNFKIIGYKENCNYLINISGFFKYFKISLLFDNFYKFCAFRRTYKRFSILLQKA